MPRRSVQRWQSIAVCGGLKANAARRDFFAKYIVTAFLRQQGLPHFFLPGMQEMQKSG